jgi:hypothetical protein
LAEFSSDELDRFAEAIQLLKLYRRAELEGPQGEDLIEHLYVDPLPHEHVHKVLRRPNSTFLIGRKGTGKSTVFLRAQKSLLNERHIVSTYVDIKTVFESAKVDPSVTSNLDKVEGALPEQAVGQLLLMTSFLHAVVEGIREDLQKQLSASWKLRMKEAFTGSYEDLSRGLDDFVQQLKEPEFVDVQALRAATIKGVQRQAASSEFGGGFKASPSGPSAELKGGTSASEEAEAEQSYSEILLRTLDLRKLIAGLKQLLEPFGISHLYVFLDDFSELPLPAMRTVVDVLIAPLNNWSEELVKFKIAAYPGRVYYGSLDKSKLDEVSLDLHSIYGQATVAEMEEKAVDFTKRLVERRLAYFSLDVRRYIEPRNYEQVWMALFQASLGNPRTLGYLLFFAYESQLLYGRRISVTGVRDAAKKYYEDKLEPYFAMGAFLHDSFDERSTIFSLKELLESLVDRARALRSKEAASIFRTIEGQHPTSHFNVSGSFDSLLSTLELNFFVTKYYVMSNRDGHRVSVYCLNYGLCEKYSIAFGRPTGTRDLRLYFVERVFDYNSLFQDYIASNQEIRCDTCDEVFDASDLESLKRFNMLCPNCRVGECRVTNISRKYEDVIKAVNADQLLPATELGILQTLSSESKPLFANDIAGELDVSYQLIGWRAKRLDEKDLVERDMVRGRREYQLSEVAKRVYFGSKDAWDLQLVEEGSLEADGS